MNTPRDSQGHASSTSSNTGAYWAASLSPGSPAPPPPQQPNIYPGHQNAFIPTTNSHFNPYASQTGLPTPGPIDNIPPALTATKVAIPRLSAPNTTRGRRRSARACEPCRQRKIKCDGIRPVCGQCVYHNNRCMYQDVKRVRDQKMLELLSQRVERYESLLRSLEGEVDESTGWRIRKALRDKEGNSKTPQAKEDDSDSDSSMGSLKAVDLVDEDLNRNENTRAAGYYGKNSEVSWMQRLEDETEHKDRNQSSESASPMKWQDECHIRTGLTFKHHKLDVPISLMNYHLDDLDIPLIEDVDAFDIPPRELADEYFDTYMTYVHPLFSAIRRAAFTAQYRQFYSRPSKPPRKWLAILNMIFAIGCRYCKLIDPSREDTHQGDLLFLTRARMLSLHEKVLFEHTDLQQIQLELLVAIYLLCLGQVNRASKFSSMALRSALSLGVNLRLTDDKTHDVSKEARCRLWWSIYSLEHLLTSIHGRASCVGESLCAVPPPTPLEEETFDQPEVHRLLQDRTYRETQLRPTLFESLNQLKRGPPWTAVCSPCPSLFFYYLVDLALISQAVLNKVYSIEGVREGTSQTEYRLQIYSLRMDRWLSNLPPDYTFIVPESGPWHVNYAQLNDESAPFTRERVCLAMNYYSARITLCRPCLSQAHAHNHPPNNKSGTKPTKGTNDTQSQEEMNPRAQFRSDMATHCLQAACSLISILPETPDVTWLARVTPWWSVLHFLMQATTALLLSLSHCSLPPNTTSHNNNNHANPHSSNNTKTRTHPNFPPLLETDLPTAITQTRKALSWIHAMALVDTAAHRAFLLCDGVVRKIAPPLEIDLAEWPNWEDLGGGGGSGRGEGEGEGNVEMGLRFEGIDELVDFEGGAGFE